MNAIEIKGLTKSYGAFKLDGLDLTLPCGCIMGLVGENGAGKSTTIRLMLGMARPDGGSRSSGLGLPFVAEVAALHGGGAALDNHDGGGAVAMLSLPAA